MKIELWQGFVMAALAVCVVKILELNTAQQRQNAFQQGQINQMERQIEYEQGKNNWRSF